MNLPKRILFTIPNFITAGSGRVMMNIVERLDRKKFSPTVCVARKGGTLDRLVEDLGIPFIEAPFTVPARPYWSLPWRTWRAAQTFRSQGFELWHSFHYADDYTEPLIARLSGAKNWVYTKKAMGWGSRAWQVRSRLATRIVADNTDMPKVMFDRPGLREKVRVIHHGIPAEQYRPEIPATLGTRELVGCQPHEVLVGCVAHLVPVKGHPTLLRAVAEVPQARLVIAGKPLDAEYVASLRQLAAELHINERVHFLGPINEIPALLNELDIVVLPTWAKWRMEGCPVALIEAMSCGRACVATDIPGSRDIIESGRNGLLVPPEDHAALAAALRQLVAAPDLRTQLGQAARQRVLERFTVEREAAAHAALYSELLGID
ncbi:MAG TPA: glycosyltransferase family 4 protein [Dongiaceae bacterium]|nr:glycosyltransferase family 4 protein [Dongiaceae bacterium]